MIARNCAIGVACCALTLALIAANAEPQEKHQGAVELSQVDKPESTLATAKVRDRQDAEIGAVHGMTRGVDGEIKTVQVALDPAKDRMSSRSTHARWFICARPM